jgi:hypothetical protein
LVLIERFVRQQRGEQASNLARWTATGSRRLVLLLTDAVLLTPDKTAEPWEPAIYECPEVCDVTEGSVAQYYLNCALQVDHAGQDWGIVNGRAERAVEFIRYYLQRRTRLRVWHGCFEELICESLDQARHRGPFDHDTAAAASEFFEVSSGDEQSFTMAYWEKWWSRSEEGANSNLCRRISSE